MNLFDIFKTDVNSKRRSHIKNLITVAMADGHLDQEEWGFVILIAERLGMSQDDIEDVKENRSKVKFVAPWNYEEKVQQVNDLAAMMMIDGNIDSKEIQLCKKIALNLEIHPRVIDDIIGDFYASQVVA